MMMIIYFERYDSVIPQDVLSRLFPYDILLAAIDGVVRRSNAESLDVVYVKYRRELTSFLLRLLHLPPSRINTQQIFTMKNEIMIAAKNNNRKKKPYNNTSERIIIKLLSAADDFESVSIMCNERAMGWRMEWRRKKKSFKTRKRQKEQWANDSSSSFCAFHSSSLYSHPKEIPQKILVCLSQVPL